MTEAGLYKVDIVEETSRGEIRELRTISWNTGDDNKQHFLLLPYENDAQPDEEEHFLAVYYTDDYGTAFGRKIKLEKYVGEIVDAIYSSHPSTPVTTWEYIGEFTQSWTKMETTACNHEWLSLRKSNCNNWSFNKINHWLNKLGIRWLRRRNDER